MTHLTIWYDSMYGIPSGQVICSSRRVYSLIVKSVDEKSHWNQLKILSVECEPFYTIQENWRYERIPIKVFDSNFGTIIIVVIIMRTVKFDFVLMLEHDVRGIHT